MRKNPGINSHCGWAATDLPWAKVLKALKFLKAKKADDVVDSDTCTQCSTSAADGERLRRQLAEEAGQLPGIRSADDIFDTPSVLRGASHRTRFARFLQAERPVLKKAWAEG